MHLKSLRLIAANLGLTGVCIYLLRKPGRLSYYLNGRGWLTWLSVAVITRMDELTSGFSAPAEAGRSIGGNSPIAMSWTLT